MKCSVSLATTNSIGVGKWSDDFSLFWFKNTVYSTLLSIWRNTVNFNGGLNLMLDTACWVSGLFISSPLLHFFTYLIPLQQQYNSKSTARFQHIRSGLFICNLNQHKSVFCFPHSCPGNSRNPSIILFITFKKKNQAVLFGSWVLPWTVSSCPIAHMQIWMNKSEPFTIQYFL